MQLAGRFAEAQHNERMSAAKPGDHRDEAYWREFLTHPDSLMRTGRLVFSRIPSNPRCQLCASPFSGWGGRVMKIIGKRASHGNPNLCNGCENVLLRHHGGAEVPSSILFADIRGSTTMAEGMSPTEFRELLDRFYTAASRAVFANNGVVDKFVGDEIMAVFAPMLGEDHTARAVTAAQAVLRATGHADPGGPWAPVGAGVHTGQVWFGAVGEGQSVAITVVGDTVNTAARLAAAAGAGEIVVSADAAAAAGLDPNLPHRSLALKGKAITTDVVTLGVRPSGAD